LERIGGSFNGGGVQGGSHGACDFLGGACYVWRVIGEA